MVLTAVTLLSPSLGQLLAFRNLSESISEFWHERIHKVDASLPHKGKPFSLKILFFSIKKTLLLSHNSTSEKVHADFPYRQKLGVINELHVVRNGLANHFQIGSWLRESQTSRTF